MTMCCGIPAWGRVEFSKCIYCYLWMQGTSGCCGLHRCYVGDFFMGTLCFLTYGFCFVGQLLDVIYFWHINCIDQLNEDIKKWAHFGYDNRMRQEQNVQKQNAILQNSIPTEPYADYQANHPIAYPVQPQMQEQAHLPAGATYIQPGASNQQNIQGYPQQQFNSPQQQGQVYQPQVYPYQQVGQQIQQQQYPSPNTASSQLNYEEGQSSQRQLQRSMSQSQVSSASNIKPPAAQGQELSSQRQLQRSMSLRNPPSIPNKKAPKVPNKPTPAVPNKKAPEVPNNPTPAVPNKKAPEVPKGPPPKSISSKQSSSKLYEHQSEQIQSISDQVQQASNDQVQCSSNEQVQESSNDQMHESSNDQKPESGILKHNSENQYEKDSKDTLNCSENKQQSVISDDNRE
ncbi:MAG: hypothetical protein EZS28_000895 [Streblomastix strix]|uniref:TM2 domain-containing protein n=1 Tax=Streblomastix strix TaxID=222440 RepID=A0A5J4X925_9EUKA|nr:MAG: hypothetical protein EZS28_000895 [Streblomastix strix]